MSRKKARESEILRFKVWTRVTGHRYETLTEMLKNSRHRTMSKLIRDILDNKPVKILIHDDTLDQYMRALSGIKKELNSIGVNINQLTKEFHRNPSDDHKNITAMKISAQYEEVCNRVQTVQNLISEIGKKWLQK